MIIPKPKSSDAFVVGGKDAISLNILNGSPDTIKIGLQFFMWFIILTVIVFILLQAKIII